MSGAFLLELSLSIFLFWVLVVLDPMRRWPARQCLPLTETEFAPTAAVDTAVVVPARNEAGLLGECLPSLLAQSDAFARLVYVNDRSQDDTGTLARTLTAAFPAAKARVIEGEPPAAGWSGKLHALECGMALILAEDSAARIRWFLLTDADIRHPPGSVGALRTLAARGGYDLVSVMVRLRAESFWEKLLIPPFVYFFQLLYPFRRVSQASSRAAAAAGGCILVSRQMLERIGGLHSIRGAVIDDIALARRVKNTGGRLWLGICPAMTSRRRYERLADIARMVARTAFTQLGYRYSLLLVCGVALLLLLIAPPLLGGAALVAGQPVSLGVAAGAWMLQALTLYPVVRHHRVERIYALTLPLAGVFYLWMTGLSAWQYWRGQGVLWKGRRLGR